MLAKERILIGWEWYQHDNKEELGLERLLLRTTRTVRTSRRLRDILLGDLNGDILSWKGASRTKRYYDSLNSERWEDLLAILRVGRRDPRRAVQEIVQFSQRVMWYEPKHGKRKRGGIGFPVASAIAFFFSAGNCPVVDWRAVYALRQESYGEELPGIDLFKRTDGRGYQLSTDDKGWEQYFDLCTEVVRQLHVPRLAGDTRLRVLDKALWMSVPAVYGGRSKEIHARKRPPQ